MPTPDETFSKLKHFQWKGVTFPVAEFTWNIDHDHAEHKWPDRDGGHIEATGRNPITITAHAIFRTGLFRVESEIDGPLYPEQYRLFNIACAERTTGVLVHPEYGTIKAKCKYAHTRTVATARDGVDVDVAWVESFDTADQLNEVLGSNSMSAAIASAQTLDKDIATLRAELLTAKKLKEALAGFGSFSDLMNSIQAAFNTVTLLSKQIGGKIDNAIGKVVSLGDTIAGFKDATLWPLVQSTERLKSSLYQLKHDLLVAGQDIQFFILPGPTTIAAIANSLGAKIPDIIKLNPDILREPTIQAGTAIRHYKTNA